MRLLFVMVLVSEEEASGTSVLSAVEGDYITEIKQNGYAKDRSVSYLDFREQQYSSSGYKSFDSVRRHGRPRQQISDIFEFVEFSKKGPSYERYHFGQCLILPKVSTLPPRKPAKIRSKERFHESNNRNYLKPYREMNFSLPRPSTFKPRTSEFENRMYHWSESIPDSQSRRCSRKSSLAESRKELHEFHDEEFDDVESQGRRCKRESKKTLDPDYDCRESSLENRRRHYKDVDELVGEENPSADYSNENWRPRMVKESESAKSAMERRKNPATGDDVEGPTMRADWNKVLGSLKRELHRSKSTPDMLWGEEKKKFRVWTAEGEMEEDMVVPKRNRSMMNVCANGWTVYNDQQEADSLNAPQSLREPVSSPDIAGRGKPRRFPSGKNFFGHFLASRGATPTDMFSNTEPFSQFWVTLSNIYGQALIIIMLVFTLTEVMDNSVKLLSLQGIYLMYLYVGSIAVIICIYIWVLIDSCSSIQNDSTGLMSRTMTVGVVHDREPENMVTSKFGSLKKAHISRDRTSNTSFYLRIGAIAFGLGTLVFNGLEMAMHSMMEGSCLNDVVFVHPILHGLFTFLQMHFLFVNSQVLVERFGLAARFGFMHLAATNLALWIRLVIWESGNEWTHYLYLTLNDDGRTSDIPTPLQLRGFPKFISRKERDLESFKTVSNQHMTQVVSLHRCLNTNSLGQLWTSSMPFLYPFIIQFSIIAAAVTYIMGQNVAKDHLFFQKQKKLAGVNVKSCALGSFRSGMNTWGVDCGGASKGLFLGILCLVTGVVVIIIFLVVKENEDFPTETIFWLTTGTLITILSITIVMNIAGLIQIRKLSVIGTKIPPLDKILVVASVVGVQLYTISGIVVGAAGVIEESDQEFATPSQKRHGMLLAVSVIQLIQAIMQSCFIVEGIRRTSLSRMQILTKPARQVVTYFMFSNAVLWAFDTFVIQSWTSQELQLRFFGVLAWGVISRVSLPLFIFFRFHSCVLLLEIWKKSYQSVHLDAGN